MRILVDTNVILDILQKREPFFSDSYSALRKALNADIDCLFSSSAVTDVFYILRKHFGSAEQAKEQIEKLSRFVIFADVQSSEIFAALIRQMPDFEDALVDAVAEKNNAYCILTRNIKDFAGSVVPAITPTEFLSMIAAKGH